MTRVCSEDCVNSRGRMLRSDEVPSLKLPRSSVTKSTPRRSLVRTVPQESLNHAEVDNEESSSEDSETLRRDVGINTDLTMNDIESVEMKVEEIGDKLVGALKQGLISSYFV